VSAGVRPKAVKSLHPPSHFHYLLFLLIIEKTLILNYLNYLNYELFELFKKKNGSLGVWRA